MTDMVGFRYETATLYVTAALKDDTEGIKPA
ncbi:unnamed protein product, partial [marine sediment metagenome]